MARKPAPVLHPAAASAPAPLTAETPDSALLAAFMADATLLPRLHRETHTAWQAARQRGEGWQAVDGRWHEYAVEAGSALRFPDFEPENSTRMQAGRVKAMRLVLAARQWFLDYQGASPAAADRLVSMRSAAAWKHGAAGAAGEHPDDTALRHQIADENERNAA